MSATTAPSSLQTDSSFGKTRLPIADISLWPIGAIPSVLVFPGPLDQARLKAAMALLVSVWPTLAGRFERSPKADGEGHDYHFNLTSSPIPYATQSITSPSYPFPDRRVIQLTIDPFSPSLPADFYVPNSDSSLFVVRHTTLLPSGNSVLGVNWCHLLGDGQAALNALKLLESFYVHGDKLLNDIKPGETELELGNGTKLGLPTFGPHVTLRPYDPTLGLKSTQVTGIPVSDLWKKYGEATNSSERVDVVLTGSEIASLKAECQTFITSFNTKPGDGHESGSGGSRGHGGVELSDQDVISGWWIGVMRRAGVSIKGLTYVCNYRSWCRDHAAFPSNLPSLAGNVAQMRFIDLPSSSSTPSAPKARVESDPAPPSADPLQSPSGGPSPSVSFDGMQDTTSIAIRIRQELNELRSNPEITLPWLANAAHHLRLATEEGTGPVLVPAEEEAFVNSNLKMDWHFTFGFPSDRTSFHTGFSIPRFLRVFQANPLPGENPAVERVELVFNVPKDGYKERVESIVWADRERWAGL